VKYFAHSTVTIRYDLARVDDAAYTYGVNRKAYIVIVAESLVNDVFLLCVNRKVRKPFDDQLTQVK